MAQAKGGGLGGQMAASYVVKIEGIKRTRTQLARLSNEIKSANKASYSTNSNAFITSSLGGSDIFTTIMDKLEGQVQEKAKAAVLHGVQAGHEAQVLALKAAVTGTGKQRKGHGPGRDKTGQMIAAIKHNVETQQGSDFTTIVGWHGWAASTPGEEAGDSSPREAYYGYQEKGTGLGNRKNVAREKTISSLTKAHRTWNRKKADRRGSWNTGVPAANSLGGAIIKAREIITNELKGLTK